MKDSQFGGRPEDADGGKLEGEEGGYPGEAFEDEEGIFDDEEVGGYPEGIEEVLFEGGIFAETEGG